MTPSAIHAPAQYDADRLLDAIACVETGRNDNAVGAHGEISRFQLLPATWESMTDIHPDKARNYRVAHGVALLYLRTLAMDLRRDGYQVTPYLLALCWKCGVSGAILRSFQPKEAKDYAQRVSNLYGAGNRQ